MPTHFTMYFQTEEVCFNDTCGETNQFPLPTSNINKFISMELKECMLLFFITKSSSRKVST